MLRWREQHEQLEVAGHVDESMWHFGRHIDQ
jgi:hypothetical protein